MCLNSIERIRSDRSYKRILLKEVQSDNMTREKKASQVILQLCFYVRWEKLNDRLTWRETNIFIRTDLSDKEI